VGVSMLTEGVGGYSWVGRKRGGAAGKLLGGRLVT
jgi:hypothetical protein